MELVAVLPEHHAVSKAASSCGDVLNRSCKLLVFGVREGLMFAVVSRGGDRLRLLVTRLMQAPASATRPVPRGLEEEKASDRLILSREGVAKGESGPTAVEAGLGPLPEDGAADSKLSEALAHIRERRWGPAQRVLEEAVRRGQSGDAGKYLAEVRAIRRCLRQLERRPRDAILHVELGRLYFGLELGDDALASFSRAVELQPDLAVAHHLLALEYLYRGNRAVARRECEWAHAIEPELPSFADLEREFEHIEATA